MQPNALAAILEREICKLDGEEVNKQLANIVYLDSADPAVFTAIKNRIEVFSCRPSLNILREIDNGK